MDVMILQNAINCSDCGRWTPTVRREFRETPRALEMATFCPHCHSSLSLERI